MILKKVGKSFAASLNGSLKLYAYYNYFRNVPFGERDEHDLKKNKQTCSTDTHLKRLDTIQNEAMRIILGCTRDTSAAAM